MSDDRFICEIPLKNPTKRIEEVLFARLDFARIAYNHCVTELNRRYGLMNESVAARQLRAESKRVKTGKSSSLNPHIVDCEDAKERSCFITLVFDQCNTAGTVRIIFNA